MRKLALVLCVAILASPALGERIVPKERTNVDRSAKVLNTSDSYKAIPISEGQGTTAAIGVVFSNFDFGAGYVVPPACNGPCMFEDYDSINDAPFIQGQFGFLGGTTSQGVVWFTYFDTVGSFVTSTGWILNPGLFIYSFDHTGLAATDAGTVQMWPNAGPNYPQWITTATWLGNATPPEIGTENPAVGTLAPDNAHLFTLEAVQLGACCILLTGECTYGPSTACGGEFHPEWDTCDPNPCPPATCGDGDLDPGEECDDGNTVPGDGCDAMCREEAQFIPAVSEWGLLAMTLIGLTVGTVLFGRRRAMA